MLVVPRFTHASSPIRVGLHWDEILDQRKQGYPPYAGYQFFLPRYRG
jgi:hypothetical protein